MKKKIFNTTVPLVFHGYRIDKFLQTQLNELSRTRLQNLIRDGHVKLNSTTIGEVSKKIKNKDKIEIIFPEPQKTLIKPNNIPLNIMYEDDDLIIINKPPGVVVHPGAGNYEKTITKINRLDKSAF